MKKKVLYKLPRKIIDAETRKIVKMLSKEKHYVNPDNDFHAGFGTIKKENLQKNGKFEFDKDFYVIHDSEFVDNYLQIKRHAQIITQKDVGAIIANTGMNKDSVVLDIGVGSGGASCFFAKIAGSVDAFDLNENNIDVAKKNAKDLGLDNLQINKGDAYDESLFEENKYDIFVLDVPEPNRALNTAHKTLKVGGWLVVYAPHISQMQEVVKEIPEKLLKEKIIEIIEREWSVGERVLRPLTKDFSHTAFLGFFRKIC